MGNTKIISKNRLESYFDTTDSTLLAWYEFDQTSGTITDLIGRGGDATIVGTMSVQDDSVGVAGRFVSGTDNLQVLTPTTSLQEITHDNTMAVSMWIKPHSANHDTVIGQYSGAGTGANWLQLNVAGGATGNEIASLLGGVTTYSSVIAEVDQWYHIVLNAASPTGGRTYNDFQIYVNGVSPSNSVSDVQINQGATGGLVFSEAISGFLHFEGWMHQCLIYDRGLKASEIEALYNKGVIQFQGGYGVPETNTVTSDQIGDTPFEVNTGTFKVDTDLINGKKVKVIEAVTTGSIYAPIGALNMNPDNAAFGTWEWWMYKDQKANLYAVNFIESNTTINDVGAYGIRWRDGDELRGTEYGVKDHFQTADDYCPSGNWYGMKITRTPSGLFTSYIRGGSFGESYSPVLLIGGSGANPFTDSSTVTSNYILVQMAAGDKIAWGGISDNYSFTKNLTVR
jgi:hypothetical protein